MAINWLVYEDNHYFKIWDVMNQVKNFIQVKLLFCM